MQLPKNKHQIGQRPARKLGASTPSSAPNIRARETIEKKHTAHNHAEYTRTLRTWAHLGVCLDGLDVELSQEVDSLIVGGFSWHVENLGVYD